jgi:thiol-disulfide isomerase/thioredoxin
MNIKHLRSRTTGVVMAAAVVASMAAAQAAVAAPTTTPYTTATYLQHALGLPAADTSPAIEPVTYDRFQWLLQQSGSFAVLIGDPATDANFKQRAQDVEAAAKDKGAAKVYWFNPNLSGSAQVGSITEPNLDIRNPGAITTLDAVSQVKYDNAWKNLVGKYLGNGLKVVQNGLNSENATVTVTSDATVVNDDGTGHAGGTKLYEYAGDGTAPAGVQDSYFLVYDKDHSGGAAKVVAWTDLTTQASSATTTSAVNAAIATVGGAQITRADQFAWWKDEVNAKQVTQAGNAAQGAGTPVLTNADGADWRINQITYPELVDLLKSGATDANAVILFGGTWCPNTRPVLPSVNADAKANGVQVFNFDTVLDGGVVGGSTTSAGDPLQTRNKVANGAVTYANPTSLYGDVVKEYLSNIKTEYGTDVTYYAGGDHPATGVTPVPAPAAIRKLQVPFLIGYRNSNVTRQWIIDKGNDAYAEYMTNWYFANPQANQLNITTIPLTAPIWTKINNALATFTWQTDVSTLYANTAIDSDDTDFLVDADRAKVTYTPAAGSTPASVSGTASSSSSGTVPISPAALASALSALGASAPATLAAAKAAYIDAQAASSPDQTLIDNLTTVVGAFNVAGTRKTRVNTVWGNATTPNSVAGGVAALHQVGVFFDGLPAGVESHRTVTADTVTAGTAPKITLAITNTYGRHPAGPVSLVVTQGGATVAAATTPVVGDAASFTLPALGAGTYDYALSYAEDDLIFGFTETGSLTVAPGAAQTTTDTGTTTGTGTGTTTGTTPAAAPKPVTPQSVAPARAKASKVKGVIAKAPTSRKGGRYKVTITTPKGASAASGKVTIKLKKGKVTKTLSGKLSHGVVTVTLPKLARGTWKVTISWPGDAHYLTASVAGPSIKVIR